MLEYYGSEAHPLSADSEAYHTASSRHELFDETVTTSQVNRLQGLAAPENLSKGKGKAAEHEAQELPIHVEPEPPSSYATCGICYTDFRPVYDPITNSLAPSGSADAVTYGLTLLCPDRHTYCLSCVSSYIRTKLERANGGAIFPVRCPECPKMTEWEVDDDLAMRVLGAELLEMWHFQRLLASMAVVSTLALRPLAFSDWMFPSKVLLPQPKLLCSNS